MLRHADIWRAIDALARQYGLTPSGLARKAGLDPTTFNKSKRITREGKLRWPSTESISKILRATGAGLDEFIAHVGSEHGPKVSQRVKLIGFGQAGAAGLFDDAGRPTGAAWDELAFPEIGDADAYALEISGDALAPVYRDGDVIVVSPAANVRRGDRVLVKTVDNAVMVRQLVRKSARKVELMPLDGDRVDGEIAADRIAWIHRIVWASQ
jgi:phage repressor protein C with HTH and peptisase S24 domain